LANIFYLGYTRINKKKDNMIRTLTALGGAGTFAGWGALGFLAGPIVGAITLTTGAVVGSVIGIITGPTVEKCFKATDKFIDTIDKVANERLPNAAKDVAEGVSKFKKDAGKIGDHAVDAANHGKEAINRMGYIVKNAGFIVESLHGVGILATGLLLGFGLNRIGLDCNPSCGNFNAELIRYAAITLCTVGVALTVFSAAKAIYSNGRT